MYIMDEVDSELQPVTMDMFKHSLSLRVFEGAFSCCAMGHQNQAYCDKEQLVQSVLGLYFKTLSMQQHPTRRMVLEHMEESKDRFFPPFFTFALPGGREEERELFGDLVTTMEVHHQATLEQTLAPILDADEVPATVFRLQQQGSRCSRGSESSVSLDSKDHLMLDFASRSTRTLPAKAPSVNA